MKTPNLTLARLRDLFSYEPSSGTFTRLANSGPGDKSPLGPVTNDEGTYQRIMIDGHRYKAHRLAVFYVTGEWPSNQVDHRDTTPANNAFVNLRDATRRLNAQNHRHPHCSNKCGLLGASPSRGRFRAQIKVDGRVRHIGVFDTAEQAHAAYVDAKRIHHPGCTL